jgi:hypothetical protein
MAQPECSNRAGSTEASAAANGDALAALEAFVDGPDEGSGVRPRAGNPGVRDWEAKHRDATREATRK